MRKVGQALQAVHAPLVQQLLAIARVKDLRSVLLQLTLVTASKALCRLNNRAVQDRAMQCNLWPRCSLLHQPQLLSHRACQCVWRCSSPERQRLGSLLTC